MNPEEQNKLDEILESVRKTEKYMKMTFWATIVVFVLPLLLIAIALPSIIRTLTSSMNALGV